MGNLNFDSSEVEPTSTDFEPVPEGNYKLEISASEVKDTKAGTGKILKVQAVVLDSESGVYDGRIIFEQFNIENPNEKAQQIGRGMLSALCRACGKIGIVEDSSELHGIPFMARVKVEPAQGEYGPKNKITKFYPCKSAGVSEVKEKNDDSDDIPF